MGIFGPPNVEKIKAKKDVNGLIKALGYQKDSLVQEDAAEALGEIGDARAIESLIAVLKDKEQKVRKAATEALGKIGEPAVESLIAALKDKEQKVRKAATEALGKIGEPAVESLIAALKDKEQKVRKAATEALGKIGEPAIEPLCTALDDPDLTMRTAAVGALQKLEADTNLEQSLRDQVNAAVEQVSDRGVKFDRKMKRGQATYELYTADDAEKAKKFLLSKKVTRGFYYIEVETPNGTWGIDKDGIYLVKLLPWQKDLSLGECEGQISAWPSMHAIMVASQGIMDNVVARIRCGKCKHEWWDGIRLEKATIVRCPKCQTYNKTRGGQTHIHVVHV